MRPDCTVGAGLEADVTQLRAALGLIRFPAQLQDVLAARAPARPSRLLWRVSGLPCTQWYDSLDNSR